jgi:hypothetical protein
MAINQTCRARKQTIFKKDKHFRAVILSVVTRVLLVGEIIGWYFNFVCLKMRFQKHFVCCAQIEKECIPKNPKLLFKFKTKFHSRAKGKP